MTADCLPPEPDRYPWLLQNPPSECNKYVQLHAAAAGETYSAAKRAILVYHEKTVLTDQDLGKASTYSLSSFNLDALGGSDDEKKKERQKEIRECWYCQKKGHFSKNCRLKRDEKEGKTGTGTPRSSEGKKAGTGKSSGNGPLGKVPTQVRQRSKVHQNPA